MAGNISGDATLGEAIRDARKRVGWPQARLAQACGYGQTWISAIETGTRGIDPRDLGKVASLLGISADELLGLAPAGDAETPFVAAMRRYDSTLDERGKRTLLNLAAATVELIAASAAEVDLRDLDAEEREVVLALPPDQRQLAADIYRELDAKVRARVEPGEQAERQLLRRPDRGRARR